MADQTHAQPMDTVLIKKLMKQKPEFFQDILNHPTQREVQVLWTQIDRDSLNQPHFSSFSFNLNAERYFYPASTVKLPAAIFALEKLNELAIPGLDKFSTMITGATRPDQSIVSADSSAPGNLPSIAHYIKEILLVSDNDAYNRLYEFIGRASMNERLKKHELLQSRIVNRLAIGDGGENARHTNPVSFYEGHQKLYKQPAAYDPLNYPLKLNHTLRGKGYINSKDSLIMQPFDFEGKNVFCLADQQLLLKKLMFPESFLPEKRFNLTTDDYHFLYRYLSAYPSESQIPAYDTAQFPNTYAKFLFYGRKGVQPEPGIRIFNKIGYSYGFLIDNMYFVDFENKVEFLLSAVIQSNDNEIYNDDQYEYETVCFPFMRQLGQLIYETEKERPRKNLPDFRKWQAFR